MNKRQAKRKAYLFAAEAIDQKLRGGQMAWSADCDLSQEDLIKIEIALKPRRVTWWGGW